MLCTVYSTMVNAIKRNQGFSTGVFLDSPNIYNNITHCDATKFASKFWANKIDFAVRLTLMKHFSLNSLVTRASIAFDKIICF